MAQPTPDQLRNDIRLAKACLDYARTYGNHHDITEATTHLSECLDNYTTHHVNGVKSQTRPGITPFTSRERLDGPGTP